MPSPARWAPSPDATGSLCRYFSLGEGLTGTCLRFMPSPALRAPSPNATGSLCRYFLLGEGLTGTCLRFMPSPARWAPSPDATGSLCRYFLLGEGICQDLFAVQLIPSKVYAVPSPLRSMGEGGRPPGSSG